MANRSWLTTVYGRQAIPVEPGYNVWKMTVFPFRHLDFAPRSAAAARICAVVATILLGTFPAAAAPRPNVVLIITDDQGYGDFGSSGNPVLKTPHLDRLAADGVRLTNFYVSPVCSPTRASLLTGRYHLRTGVRDTYLGRSMMNGHEQTLAESLHAAGYRTGIFGKWHLGDCFPMRPQDQGFEECLVHGGGGVGQPSDPPGNHYQDPQLRHNGRWKRYPGYCSDVYTTAAIDFVQQHQGQPFFVYLAFNCPHAPLEVPEELLARYPASALESAVWPDDGFPVNPRHDVEAARRVYAMVSNIDDNVGRLLMTLDELQLREDTIVVFLTDNGPQQQRYNAGLRGLKASVYEGGIRVPCFARWPARWKPGTEIVQPTAHMDWMPTLLAACGVAPPVVAAAEQGKEGLQAVATNLPLPPKALAATPLETVRKAADGEPSAAASPHIDGRNLLPLFDDPQVEWPPRRLFFQWHRGDEPARFRNMAVRDQRWKLVQPQGGFDEKNTALRFELYDIAADPYERHDVAAEHPNIVAELRTEYDRWFNDVWRGQPLPAIVVGTRHEPLTTLTRQDWRGPAAGWSPESIGHWDLIAEEAGTFDVSVRFAPTKAAARVTLDVGGRLTAAEVSAGAGEHVFREAPLPVGPFALQATILEGARETGPQYVELSHSGR